MEDEGTHEAPVLAEGLWAVDDCCGVVSQFSLRVWTLEGGPCFSEQPHIHTQDYGKKEVERDRGGMNE